MTYNTLSYIIYLPIAIYITVIVGYKLYKNGLVYVESIFGEVKLAQAINKILLVGYYLTNVGYAIITVKDFKHVSNVFELLNEVSLRLASIVLILAALHYINIIVLSFGRKSSIIKIN